MTETGLTKLYDRLTPRERVALILAAEEREDEVDRERLIRVAPRCLYQIPDHYGFADGLVITALHFTARVLEKVAFFWQVSTHATELRAVEHDRAASVERTVRAMARLILIEVDGWCHFCVELGIDPDSITRDQPGFEDVNEVLESAQLVALSETEMEDWFAEHSPDQGLKLRDIQHVANEYRRIFENRRAIWDN